MVGGSDDYGFREEDVIASFRTPQCLVIKLA